VKKENIAYAGSVKLGQMGSSFRLTILIILIIVTKFWEKDEPKRNGILLKTKEPNQIGVNYRKAVTDGVMRQALNP